MDEATRNWLDERFGRMADLVRSMCDDHKRYDDMLKDHEGRLVKLERMAWLLGGICLLLVPVALDAVRSLLGI